jgi:hypothetical protein
MGRYLVLVPMALALAACGGGGGGGALSLDPVANAAEKTAKQGSAKVHFTMRGGGITGTGTGLFDNDGSAGRMSMDVDARGKSLHMDAVTQGFVIYLKSPLFQSQPGFPKGKEWVEIDVEKAAKSLGVDLGSLQSMSPGSGLSVLRGSSKPTKVGKETVAGVETTHYRTKIDLEAAANNAKGETAKTLRKLVELTGQKTMSGEAWVDGNGLVRKESYSQRFGPGQPLVRITEVLYDFGPRVSIPAPPSDKVFDATNLAGS